MRRGVVVGNIDELYGYHSDDLYESKFQAARRARERFLRQQPPMPRRVSRPPPAPREFYDAETGELVDESGLTVHHQVDPDLKGELRNLTQTAKSRGIWIAGAFGVLLGILLAGLAWWFAQQAISAAAARRR